MKHLSVTVDNWIYDEVDKRKENKKVSRSEIVNELLSKAMMFKE